MTLMTLLYISDVSRADAHARTRAKVDMRRSVISVMAGLNEGR